MYDMGSIYVNGNLSGGFPSVNLISASLVNINSLSKTSYSNAKSSFPSYFLFSMQLRDARPYSAVMDAL